MTRRRAPTDDSPAPPRRRMRGFEAASALVAPQIRSGAESRGFAIARLLTNWAEIVGEDTAAHTRPVKIGHGGKGGLGATLTVLTDGAHAPLVQMALPAMRQRINAVYGFNAIARIAVTQTAPQGFAEGQAAFRPAPKAAPVPTPAARAEAEGLATRFTDPALAEAMRQLTLNRRTRGRYSSSPDRKDHS